MPTDAPARLDFHRPVRMQDGREVNIQWVEGTFRTAEGKLCTGIWTLDGRWRCDGEEDDMDLVQAEPQPEPAAAPRPPR